MSAALHVAAAAIILRCTFSLPERTFDIKCAVFAYLVDPAGPEAQGLLGPAHVSRAYGVTTRKARPRPGARTVGPDTFVFGSPVQTSSAPGEGEHPVLQGDGPPAESASPAQPADADPGDTGGAGQGGTNDHAGHVADVPRLVRAAAIKTFVRPDYPRESRILGEEGTAVFELGLSSDATLTRITLVRSSGYPRLDEAAREALRKATFVPACENGRPVACVKRIAVRFELEGGTILARMSGHGE